ncbi:hypothetical protein OF83DRAFT_424236 [Amylostereum chailletii]|nr:hypothetical protein OF83DRAFT_424236 [Amylostereum chailletii]
MEGVMSLIVNLSLPALETLSIRILAYNFHSLAQDADIAQISSLMQARPPRSLRLVPALSQGVHIYAWDTENMGVVKNLQGAGRANTTLSFKARDHARLVPDFHMMRFYRILCTGLPLADVCTLTLEIDHTFTAAEWTEMLAPLVRVTTLKLIGRKMIPALLLAATPRPTSLLHSRAAPELLFPALELIIITQLYLRATPSSPSLNILLGNRALPELADARRRIGRPLRVAFEDCPRYSDALAKAMEGVAETSWDNAGIWDDRRCEEAWCGTLFELETL